MPFMRKTKTDIGDESHYEIQAGGSGLSGLRKDTALDFLQYHDFSWKGMKGYHG
jgi:hypothetical protein